jgi:hypothetical protein
MKTLYTSLFALSLTTLSFGQVTLTGADVNGTIGESFAYTQSNWMAEGPAGAAQTWDLSSLVPTTAGSLTHGSANAGFPATNITQTDAAGSSIYYDFSAAGQTIHGIEAGVTLITYQNAQTSLEFPLSLGVSGSDSHACTFTSGGYPFSRAGTTTWEADGWGTVITPNGTYTDVLRVKLTQTYTDTYSLGTIDYDVTIYQWLKAGIHYPVAGLTDIVTSLGDSQYGVYLTGNVSLDEMDKASISVYPNPTSGNVTINGVSTGEYQVFSNDGRVVLQGTINDSSTLLNLDQFQSGTYRIVVQHESGILTQQIIKL